MSNVADRIRSVLTGIAGLFVALAVVSYQPADLPFLASTPNDPVHNLGGVIGAWVGFAGRGVFGWASLLLVRRGTPAVTARYRVCVGCAVVAVLTMALPLAGSPSWAAAGISLGFCAVAGLSVNLYALPLDTFGAARAAFAVSMLVASYGGVQALISGAIGWTVEHHGYAPVTTVAAVTPLLACAVLRAARAER